MKAFDSEFEKLVQQFEKDCKKYFGGRMDREKDVETTRKGEFYKNGETNKLFRAYMLGYSYRDGIARLEGRA